VLFSALTVALRHFFYSKKALIVSSNRKPPPSFTVIGNPPDANRYEYHGGHYAQYSCKGKRHPDEMPSDKKIQEILFPSFCEALSAISALSAGLLVSHADSILLSRRNKRNQGNLVSLTLRTLSAISAISAGLKTCQLVGFVPTREAFLLFLPFLRDIIISCT